MTVRKNQTKSLEFPVAKKNIISTEIEYVVPGPWITPEKAADICCKDVPIPQCKKKVGPWNGYSQEEALKKCGVKIGRDGRDSDGYPVEIIWVGVPKNGICGTIETTIQTNSNDCCDGVEPLVYDDDSSVDVMDHNSIGIVSFEGGKYPVTVDISGEGFWLNRNRNSKSIMIYAGDAFAVYTDDKACGMCQVDISDGCSVTSGSIRSIAGEWYRTSDWWVQQSCPFKAPFEEWNSAGSGGPAGTNPVWEVTRDDLRILQAEQAFGGSGSTCDQDIIDDGNLCADYFDGSCTNPHSSATYSGCMTGWCEGFHSVAGVSGIFKECYGYCYIKYPGYCAGSGHNPYSYSCLSFILIHFITTFEWRCPEDD